MQYTNNWIWIVIECDCVKLWLLPCERMTKATEVSVRYFVFDQKPIQISLIFSTLHRVCVCECIIVSTFLNRIPKKIATKRMVSHIYLCSPPTVITCLSLAGIYLVLLFWFCFREFNWLLFIATRKRISRFIFSGIMVWKKPDPTI